MIKGRVKITDLAKELGVSTSTVSRALSNEGRISAKTRAAVTKLANEWGYKPNPFAINLLKKQSKNIGLVLPEFTHHYFSKVLDGISKVLDAKEYHLFINTHEGQVEKEQKAIGMLNAMRVDGIIASYARETSDFAHYLEVIEDDVPLVFLDRMCEDLDASYVITDDFSGCIEAVSHLKAAGRQNILHIAGPENLSTSFNRRIGFKEGLKQNELTINDALVVGTEDDSWKDSLIKIVKSENVDGILAFSDYLAFEAVEILKSKGINVPNDISVIGFADEPVASYMSPKLTTVRQPAELMGQRAAEMLLWHIENPDSTEFLCETLPTELHVRASTIPAKKPLAVLKNVS
ncbi:MAG: LacI family DNA-binding transcriptional regulator [Cyclobacteriaceae bacterium]